MSPHFSFQEMIASEVGARRGLPNLPGPTALENLKRLAAFLERVRAVLDKPVLVNSAFRSRAVNAAVGGKPSSQHLTGCAADIRVPGMTPDAVVRAIRAAGLGYDQLIREFDTWTHVSIPALGTAPRAQVLIIDRRGARPHDATA